MIDDPLASQSFKPHRSTFYKAVTIALADMATNARSHQLSAKCQQT